MLLLVSEPLFACRPRSEISEVQYFTSDVIALYRLDFVGHFGQTKSSKETSSRSDEA